MREFLRKVFNTEFLPMAEVRKIKVWLVMLFLFVITLVTIPFSFFFNYQLIIKIISIAAMFFAYGVILLLIKFNKTLAAIQISILYSIAITLFYTQGISSFYAYLFFYITLTIIIFYQEIYSFISYGTLVLAMAIYYTLRFKDSMVILNDIYGAAYIYIAGIVLFYLINLIHILHNEKLYTDMSYEWVKMNHVVSDYQKEILFHLENIRKENHESPIYENLEFQKAAFELSQFISEQVLKDGSEIANLIDLYIYIHEKGLENILNNEEISMAMKQTSDSLKKYLFYENSDMFAMIINFYIKFIDSKPYEETRYNYNLNAITDYDDEQIIALCLIYSYLRYQMDSKYKWQKMNRKEDPYADIFSKISMNEFFSERIIAFYNDNQEMFEAFLSDIKDGVS